MNIFINHESAEVPEGSSLSGIITERLGDKLRGIAIAVNDTVLPRTAHSSYILQPGDRILIIKATQGG